MARNNSLSHIGKISSRRGAAEVISSLLLVAITVVGAVILTSFLDETFVSGSLSQSGSDSTIKTIKLIKFDSRSGGNLLNLTNLNNTDSDASVLCRQSCSSNPSSNPIIPFNGTEFVVIQIENQSVEPIFLENIWLDNATHRWDANSAGSPIDVGQQFSSSGGYPGDGRFSIFSTKCDDTIANPCDPNNPAHFKQRIDNQIQNGESVNLLLKLDATNPDIPLSKTIRTQFNIGSNQMPEVLIESGGAQ